jgi:anti-sigma factor RsiW
MRWRRRRAIVCREAVELMSDYLDGALAAGERRRLEAHLAGCAHCSEYLRQLEESVAALGRVEPEALSDEALGELVSVYRRWKRQSSPGV